MAKFESNKNIVFEHTAKLKLFGRDSLCWEYSSRVIKALCTVIPRDADPITQHGVSHSTMNGWNAMGKLDHIYIRYISGEITSYMGWRYFVSHTHKHVSKWTRLSENNNTLGWPIWVKCKKWLTATPVGETKSLVDNVNMYVECTYQMFQHLQGDLSAFPHSPH